MQNITNAPLYNQAKSEHTLINHSDLCHPFLRWAGGKRWLKKQLNNFLPKNGFNQYHEPFIGGGSIFFYLHPYSKKSFISDSNKDLINTYTMVRDKANLVVSNLKKFENSKEYYYEVRSSKYNSLPKKAAQFIYLNQMSFNGIYRVNASGNYNVPYGYRDKYQFDYENLKKVGNILQNTYIYSSDFQNTVSNIKKDDLVFIDPPYTVAHNNNGFIEYNKKIFSLEDQKRLSNMIGQIKEIGAFYIMTNANHESLRSIFGVHKDKMITIERNSLIGGIGAKRGRYSEIIMTNRGL
jgi:DNA adenine methylase